MNQDNKKKFKTSSIINLLTQFFSSKDDFFAWQLDYTRNHIKRISETIQVPNAPSNEFLLIINQMEQRGLVPPAYDELKSKQKRTDFCKLLWKPTLMFGVVVVISIWAIIACMSQNTFGHKFEIKKQTSMEEIRNDLLPYFNKFRIW